jgi:hypothetical protein
MAKPAGLYLEQKSSDPATIVKPEAPKQIVMQMLHGGALPFFQRAVEVDPNFE